MCDMREKLGLGQPMVLAFAYFMAWRYMHEKPFFVRVKRKA